MANPLLSKHGQHNLKKEHYCISVILIYTHKQNYEHKINYFTLSSELPNQQKDVF